MTSGDLTAQEWRRLGLSAYLPTGLSTIGFGAIAPLVALSARQLGATVAEAAFVVALMGIGTLLGALSAGALATRFGEKRTLLAAMTTDVLVLLVAWRAPNVEVLSAAVFVAGLSGAALGLARQSSLTEVVPTAFRARALSTLGGVFRIGSFLGPLAGALVISRWGLPQAYLMAAGTSLLSAIITMLLPDLPTHVHAHETEEPPALFRVMRAHARTYLTVGLGGAGLMLVRSARDALLPLWGDQRGFDPAVISLIFSLSSGVDMLLFYAGGSLMDRFGRAFVAVPSMVIMGLSFGLLPLTSTEVGMGLVAVGLGLGNGISSGVVMTLGSDASPAVGRSHFLAGWRLTSGLGQAVGPVLITAITAVAPLLASVAFLS